jgi:CRP-like cAMP-binding protein
MSSDPRNFLFNRLSAADRALLEHDLEPIDLPIRFYLEHRNRKIEHIYFIEDGIASVVAHGAHRGDVEVGLIGHEGVSGLAVILGTDRSPNDTFMQVAGSARRITTEAFQKAMDESSTLRQPFLLYAQAFAIQTSQTALANGRHKLEERLARWLLMAHDRRESDDLQLTHESIAVMLGVRRPGVTLALNLLEKNGLITVGRGLITVSDREGLIEAANGAYGAAEAEMLRLFQ